MFVVDIISYFRKLWYWKMKVSLLRLIGKNDKANEVIKEQEELMLNIFIMETLLHSVYDLFIIEKLGKGGR